MTDRPVHAAIISDANVLIDFAESSPDILKLISKHIQQLYVALPIVKEVDQFSSSDIRGLGVQIIEPSLGQINEASQIAQDKPSLSGQDALCFIIARDNNWICLTNDKALRSFCSAQRVSCIWGLEIMLYLVTEGVLTAKNAYNIAKDIQSQNKYIKPQTLVKFRKKLGL